MSTRGVFGFRIDGQDKLTYNHSDSYPDCLGDMVVTWVRKACAPNRVAQTMTDVAGIVMVDNGQSVADPAHIKRLGDRYLDMHVGGGLGVTDKTVTWYRLLRNAQPTHGIEHTIDAGVMIRMVEPDVDFGYIVNFDEMTVEFYSWPGGAFSASPEPAVGRLAPSMTLRAALPIPEIDKWRKTWQRDVFPQDPDE